MRFTVATNFDDRLIEELKGSPVVELFGKLPRDFVGGGRASYMLSPLSRGRLEGHVREARRRGIRFNYLLNAACLGNREFTRRGQREIERLLEWLGEIVVEAVTVSVPSLLEIVKKRYPRFYVRVGVFAQVDDVRKAKAWEELGADGITLNPLAVNRNFDLLREIRRAIKCELQLIPNADCLQSCFMAPYHMVGLSHASQSGYSPFMIDYCFLKCTALRLEEPVNYIRAVWIRPEDLGLYESLGYRDFKILERNAPTEVMVRRVKAYAERRYEGNLLDLIQPYAYRSHDHPKRYWGGGLLWNAWYFLKPFLVNPKRLLLLRRLAERRGMLRPPPEQGVFIDNRTLDGFLASFPQERCAAKDCASCRYCFEWAARVVQIDPAYRRECLALYREVLEDLCGGGMRR